MWIKKCGDETVDLTNIPCERVLGVLKYEYWNTSFGSIRISSEYWSGLTWAKQLRSIGYWEKDEIGTSWSASQSSARRVHDVVLDSLSLIFPINSWGPVDRWKSQTSGYTYHGRHKFAFKSRSFGPFLQLNSSINIWKNILKQSQS